MLRAVVNRIVGRPSPAATFLPSFIVQTTTSTTTACSSRSLAYFSSSISSSSSSAASKTNLIHDVAPEDMPFLHHKKRPRFKDYIKFKSPRKRASKLYHDIMNESVQTSKQAKPEVFDVDYAVGDAIECQIVEQGGTKSTELKKVRGVVIGKFNKAVDTSVLIRDVVMGTIVERRLPLHSPMVKSIKLLEKNFIYKGRRKVKRAKLYFLRDRNPNGTAVLCRCTVLPCDYYYYYLCFL